MFVALLLQHRYRLLIQFPHSPAHLPYFLEVDLESFSLGVGLFGIHSDWVDLKQKVITWVIIQLKVMFKHLLIFAGLLYCALQIAMTLQKVQIAAAPQTMTITYLNAYPNPMFAYYIQSGSISSSQFSLAYVSSLTVLSSSSMNISFNCYADPNEFTNGGFLQVQILISDIVTYQMNYGVVALDIASTTLSFNGVQLAYPDSKMEIYPLAFPMVYSKIQNSTTLTNNQIVLNITASPSLYMTQSQIYFAYVYFTNVYSANNAMALYQGFSQNSNSYQFSYASFAYTPSEQTLFMAVKSYSSATTPFFSLSSVKILTSSGSSIDNFSLGYSNPAMGVTYSADAFIFSYSPNPCPSTGQYLYYPVYFTSLPYGCASCHWSCNYCFPPNILQPNITDAYSCTSCITDRYLNRSSNAYLYYGNCLCLPGLQNSGNTCVQCAMLCLTFKAVFIQTTSKSTFLLYFSFPSIVEKTTIDKNLVVKINGGKPLSFDYEKTNDATYTISLTLDQMKPCENTACTISFQFKKPQYIRNADQSKSLSNSVYSVRVANHVNYYNLLPEQLKSTFQVMGMVMLGTYTSGYTSLFKILFQLEQLIDAHKYLNLTLPIVYNELVQQLQNFKFLDFTQLLPKQTRDKFTSFIPNDLDQLGSPKLIYYEQGVNYCKNMITGFISLGFMLLLNYSTYLILKLIPWRLTRLLAKKINKRKIITIHDSFDQLVFPVFFFSITNFEYFLLHSNLYWIYAFAAICGFICIAAPFLVVLFVYLNRKKEHKIEIYEDLLQDNTLSQPVTYVYYIFNYYRKIFFALCLTDTLPGIVQIYLLICLNTVHLAFQIYLIIAKTYMSKSKVIVRLVNSLCIIAVQILIIVYNLNWYDTQTMVNIGLSCFYLSITTALLNIIDALIKLMDTFFQEVNSKKKVQAELQMFKQNPVLQQFTKKFICNIGKQLEPPKILKDPKQIKFHQDKQLMEHTFHRNADEGSDISEQISQAGADKQPADQVQLVFIDDDWTNIYPIESDTPLSESLQKQTHKKYNIGIIEQSHNDLYQIPEDIDREVEKIAVQLQNNKKKNIKRQNKFEPQVRTIQRPKRTPARTKHAHLQIKPIQQIKMESEEMSQI